MTKPRKHSRETEQLARKLKAKDVYNWLVTDGYFPESYVLPPCFHVTKHPEYGKRFFLYNKKKFVPRTSEICETHFPKTELTDRTFGIMEPKLHSDICYEISTHWDKVLDVIFHADNRVYSYSFPFPLSERTPGVLGRLCAGRMIYEWIEMMENDLAEEAYAYEYLVTTDVKNYYPSIYTHSIAWALHGKKFIRSSTNRNNYNFVGNRIDKIFQSANDGCTNGIPIGSAVSDLIAELILSAIDSAISPKLRSTLAVRFKDDYRFLCRTQEEGRKAIKLLQRKLKEFNLELNEEKTKIEDLPEGIFREWRARYDAICPKGGRKLSFNDFMRFYRGVLQIDEQIPGTGIIDRFIADLHDKKYRLLLDISKKNINKTISLLLLLARRRTKVLPRVLGMVEAMMIASGQPSVHKAIEMHLNRVLAKMSKDLEDNRYAISWILYFLKSNRMRITKEIDSDDPIITSIQWNRGCLFPKAKDFRLFRGVRATRRAGTLLRQTDVFKPQ